MIFFHSHVCMVMGNIIIRYSSFTDTKPQELAEFSELLRNCLRFGIVQQTRAKGTKQPEWRAFLRDVDSAIL